jgi:hypothetical protein
MAEHNIRILAETAAAVLRAPRWWELANLRRLADGKPLGYACGPKPEAPEFAFAAIDTPEARRFFLVMPDVGLVCCDLAGAGARWVVEGSDPQLTPRTVVREDGVLVNALLVPPGLQPEPLSNVDVVGLQAGQRVAVFHREKQMQNSAVYFDAKGKGKLTCLVAGLAPGYWEVWWNGYLEDLEGMVRPESGALWFSGDPGSYFIRRP